MRNAANDLMVCHFLRLTDSISAIWLGLMYRSAMNGTNGPPYNSLAADNWASPPSRPNGTIFLYRHRDISDATPEQACELSRPNADSFVAILKPFSLTKSARLRRVLVQATQQ